MPAITLTLVPWPVGTTVSAYRRTSELRQPDMPPPTIPAAAEATVTEASGSEDRSLTFDLPAGEYWAIAPNLDAPPPKPPVKVERPSTDRGYASGVVVTTLGGPPAVLYLSFTIEKES